MLIRLVHERAQNHIVKIASPVDRIFSAVDGVCVYEWVFGKASQVHCSSLTIFYDELEKP